MTGCETDAVACFHQMSSGSVQEIDEERANWTRGECLRSLPRHHSDHPPSDFKSRCRGKLEVLGDSAANAKQYDESIAQYTAALSLDPVTPQDLLVKRSNALAGKGARVDALNDAKEWARLMLTCGSWKDVLVADVDVSMFLRWYPSYI